MTTLSLLKNREGQSLIELMMVILLISILAVGGTIVITDTLNEMHFVETQHRLMAIRKALVGDPDLTAAGARSSFGYQGDMGGIPTALQTLSVLWTNPSLPIYAMNTTTRFGIGWNGPYLNTTNTGVNYTVDGWGNAFVYSPTANPPTVASLGADNAVGGTGYDQDITMELSPAVTSATVYGVVVSGGAVYNGGAEIEINQPDGNGRVYTTCSPGACPLSTTADGNGNFIFTGVSIGIRSVTIYAPNKTSPIYTLGPVVFSITGPNYLIPAKMLDLAPL